MGAAVAPPEQYKLSESASASCAHITKNPVRTDCQDQLFDKSRDLDHAPVAPGGIFKKKKGADCLESHVGNSRIVFRLADGSHDFSIYLSSYLSVGGSSSCQNRFAFRMAFTVYDWRFRSPFDSQNQQPCNSSCLRLTSYRQSSK